MKFVVFSDFHAYLNPNKSYIDSDGENSWFKIQKSILNHIFECAVDYNVDYLIHNGDLFEEKFRINQYLYNEVWKLFYDFHKRYPDIEIIFNIGNHDVISSNKTKAITTLSPFSSFAEIVDTPTNYNNKFTIIPNGFKPHKKSTNILFTHDKYAGLKHGETGYIYKDKECPISLESVKDYDVVFNGHIHHPQIIGNIINIGSTMIDDWGTADADTHGFYYYNDGDVKFIKTKYPMFIKVKEYNSKLKDRILNNNYDFFRIDISREELSDEIFKKYNVFPNIIKYKKRKERIKKSTSKKNYIKEYVKQSDTELDKEKLIQIGESTI